MKKLDREETRILAAVERADWRRPKTAAKDMAGIVAAARATVRKDERVNIRISSRDLTRIRKAALEEGIPYQTFIASILHKFIAGRLVERPRSTTS